MRQLRSTNVISISFFEHDQICHCSNINSAQFQVYNVSFNWLIDTGASLSVIKYESLLQLNKPYHKERIDIKGIGGNITSEGYIYLRLSYNGRKYSHKFYVFKDLACKGDGIIGQDFLSKYKCILNFEMNTLTLNYDEQLNN